jgi:hypothetical protein
LNTKAYQKFLLSVIALLVIVPVLVAGAYLIRQNYMRNNLITGTRKFGIHRGEHYHFTEDQRDKLDRQAMLLDQQTTEKQRERAKLRLHK